MGPDATGAKFGLVGYQVTWLCVACLAALVVTGSGPVAIAVGVGQRSRQDPGG